MARGFRLTPQGQPRLSENDVERACLDLLGLRGWYTIRLQVGLFRTLGERGHMIRVGTPGLPDYVAVHEKHRAFFMETKAPGKRLSKEQEKTQWAIRECYRIAVVSIDRVEQLAPWLDAHEAGT